MLTLNFEIFISSHINDWTVSAPLFYGYRSCEEAIITKYINQMYKEESEIVGNINQM
jgi:hypothetical protein